MARFFIPFIALLSSAAFTYSYAQAPVDGPASRIAEKITPRADLKPFADGKFTLNLGEVIVFTGGENMVLEQACGHIETALTARWKEAGPKFRHMGWEGDTVYRQNRMMAWGAWSENLTAAGATVVIAWFGQLEALDATRSVADFRKAYGDLLDAFAKVTPRIVLLAAPLFQKPTSMHVPDNTARNERVQAHNAVAMALANERGLSFLEIPTQLATRNGMHLTEDGLAAIAKSLAAPASLPPTLQAAVVEKNRLWFDTWRCMNWAFAFGDRTTQPFAKGTGDRPDFVQEIRHYQPLLTHADAVIQARAHGKPDPAPLPAAPPLADPPAISVEQQLANFKIREGFDVQLFADEKLGVIRPIQIRWDERGRLWVACVPAYPQLQPGEHGNDFITVLEDTDGDGKADKTSRFADKLTMPMGFEFAPEEMGGGIWLVESTKLVHLPDANRDGLADGKNVILSGFGTGDSHQNANSLRWGPDGALWFTQGYHIWSHVETPQGLVELNRSGVWRFNPRTLALHSFLNESSAGLNGWGTAWDAWGQIFHGSGADYSIWHTTPALVPAMNPRLLPTALAKSRGKSMEPEFLESSHLPDDFRGILLKSTYYTSQVQLYRLHDEASSFRSEDLGDLLSGGNEFRPVETRVGPDGAIYVCDWLNPIIGHYQASYRDPRRDRSHGRIWRITAKGRALVKNPQLAEKSSSELLTSLQSAERWERDVAKFALYRKPWAEVQSAMAKMDLTTTPLPLLYELSGVLGAHEQVNAVLLNRLLGSDDFRWRAWGTRLLGLWAAKLPDVLPKLAQATADPHPRVRLEAVVACAWQGTAEAAVVATAVLDHPMDPGIEHALEQAMHYLAPQWQAALHAGKLDVGNRPQALAKMLTTARGKNLAGQFRQLLATPGLPSTSRNALLAGLAAYGNVPDQLYVITQCPAEQPFPQVLVEAFVSAAKAPEVLQALWKQGQADAKIAACRLLAQSSDSAGLETPLQAALEGQFGLAVQKAAMPAFAKLHGPAAVEPLLAFVTKPQPALRAAAIAAVAPLALDKAAEQAAILLKNVNTLAECAELLSAFFQQKQGAAVLAKHLPPNMTPDSAKLCLQWMAEKGHDDAALRKILHTAAGLPEPGDGLPAYTASLVAELAAKALAEGDAKRGEAVFRSAQAACLACHKLGNEGGVLGPDLSAVGLAMTREGMVEAVLWPKRQVKEGYLLTSITTKSGQQLQGYKTAESPERLSLRDITSGSTQNIVKSDIASKSDVGTLMPEGIALAMTDGQRLDLLRFLFELGK